MLLPILNFACQQNKKELDQPVEVQITDIRLGKIQNTTYQYLFKKVNQYKTIFIYTDTTEKPPIENFSYHLVADKEDSKQLIFDEHSCSLVDSLKINSYTIYKYDYNDKGAIDEELFIYFNPELGFLGYQEKAWDGGIAVKGLPIDITNNLISDTSCFFQPNCF